MTDESGLNAMWENVPVEQPVAVPDGWVLVPVEPTEDIIVEIVDGIRRSAWGRDNVIKLYKRLLAAAPTPPELKATK